MRDEAARRGNDYICTETHAFHLLVIAVAVIAAVDGDTRHVGQVIGEALHGLVNLLCQLTGWRHDDAVDGILGIIAAVKL